tara:strand:- start:769 stop:1656 length:888 start_codon:yes stop_codon:yes gene_type:complete
MQNTENNIIISIDDDQIPNNQIPNNQIPNNQIPNNQISINKTTNNKKNPNKRSVSFDEKSILQERHYFIKANQITENNIIFHKNLGNCSKVYIEYILFYDNVLKHKNGLDLIKKKKISDIPFIFADVQINNNDYEKIPFFQDKTIGEVIYFKSKQKILVDDLVTKLQLNIFDNYQHPINISQEIKIDKVIYPNSLEMENQTQHNKKFLDMSHTYLQFIDCKELINCEDTIKINDNLYTIIGLCKLVELTNTKHKIENINEIEDYNTIIIETDNTIRQTDTVANISRIPMCLINVT